MPGSRSRQTLLAVAFCALFSTSAHAANASATAELDWGSVLFNFIAGAATFDAPWSRVSAEVYDEFGNSLPYDSDSVSDHVTPIDAVAFDDDGFGTTTSADSIADATTLGAYSSIMSPLPGSALGWRSAYASAGRYADINATVDGLLLIEVPYFIAATTDDMNVYADASVQLSANRDDGNGVYTWFSAQAGAYADFGYGNASPSEAGNLVVAIPLTVGDTIYLSGDAYASVWASGDAVVVPLPAGVWLMLGGLVPLLLRRRT